MFGQGAEVDRRLLPVRCAQRLGERFGDGQAEAADQPAVPLGAEPDAEGQPDQVGQREQHDGQGLPGVAVHDRGQHPRHRADHQVPEQHHPERERGRADGELVAHQGARQRRAPGHREAAREHQQEPGEADADRARDVRVEADLRGEPECAAQRLHEVAAQWDDETVPGDDRQQDEGEQPDHGRPGDPAEQFTTAGHRAEAQLTKEHLGHRDRAGHGDGQRHRADPGVQRGEAARTAVESDGPADGERERRGQDGGEAAVR